MLAAALSTTLASAGRFQTATPHPFERVVVLFAIRVPDEYVCGRMQWTLTLSNTRTVKIQELKMRMYDAG